MKQWLGLDPLVAFQLRRIEARGWSISVHMINNSVEIHAVNQSVEPPLVQIARCDGGQTSVHQKMAVRQIVNACDLKDVVLGDE